ncbi:MAG: ECF-type sigma factor [Planctomycetota bacterium]
MAEPAGTSHLEDLSVILNNAKLGDATAESNLHRKFVGRLVALAGKRINARFKAKIEPEEIVQSVFFSFFRRNQKDEFVFEDWNDVWALLVKITVRKCTNRVEGFLAAKRDVSREVLEVDGNTPVGSLTVEPTAEEIAVFNESLDNLFDLLSELQKEVVVFRLQGYSNLEISEKIGRSERTVYRTLNQVREIFMQLDQ